MIVYYKKEARGHPDSIECEGFEEMDQGISLYNTGDEPGSKNTIGYIPHEKVSYILPDDQN